EAMGVVEIRHGSGVYVTRSEEFLLLASPDYGGTVTKKLLLDLIGARIPIEVQSVADAVRNATPARLLEMQRLLSTVERSLDDAETMNAVNTAFHQQIALASGNTVTAQMLTVLHELFAKEQRLIVDRVCSHEKAHREHLAILEAIALRDETLAVGQMRTHLEGIQSAILRWNPEDHPVK
ncbi:MAG: FCD domain-containing protein, partial [Gemmatimonadaceae bacterium]